MLLGGDVGEQGKPSLGNRSLGLLGEKLQSNLAEQSRNGDLAL